MAIDKKILNATQMTIQDVVKIPREEVQETIRADRLSWDWKQRSSVCVR